MNIIIAFAWGITIKISFSLLFIIIPIYFQGLRLLLPVHYFRIEDVDNLRNKIPGRDVRSRAQGEEQKFFANVRQFSRRMEE